jgi:hypothetical protein
MLMLSLTISACTVLTSELPAQLAAEGRKPAGVYYALPKGIVPVKLTVDRTSARYFVVVGDPIYIPDPNHRYFMRYRALPNYADNISIAVNERGLPQEITATTMDKTTQIILNLAKFFGAVTTQAGSPSSAADLVTLNIDPTSEREVARTAYLLDGKMREHAAKASSDCKEALKSMSDSDPKRPDMQVTCDSFASVAAGDGGHVSIKVRAPQHIVAGKSSDCTVGLCYRIKEPYVVTFGIGPYQHATIVELPNRAVPIELDITRAFLVTKIQDIKFDGDGFLSDVSVEKPSELLEAAKLPVAVVTAVADGLTLKADLITEQKNLAQAQLDRIKADADLLKQRTQ